MAAKDERHAAWQEEAYAVYEGGAARRRLIGRARAYLDAVDLAAEHLARTDPAREGKVRELEIVAPSGQVAWRYSHDAVPPPLDLVAHWGFDAVRWRGPERRWLPSGRGVR